ncbi:DUF1642 domain-containing protein [uncultured Streptococcus sp.]|jgi:hypothetical protein|uniref:DUF1642 domain-containing protein n=1 Tax=uncultured Streptococcus sp. TaxID=83427 RepID=UPI0025E4B7E1|nr:DUF1642 domain-containing protein [uncultured Streptococcus sp.]
MMKRDEAVQKLATVGHLSMAHAEDLYDSLFEKPVVKQCVADWYEKHKYNLESDIYYLIRCWEDEERTSDFYKWFDNSKNEAIKILVNMHQFGYEVEKEPRYTVRIKATNQYLCNDGIGPHFSPGFRTDFRKRDVEELGLGWVFDCPGVEVKEVE